MLYMLFHVRISTYFRQLLSERLVAPSLEVMSSADDDYSEETDDDTVATPTEQEMEESLDKYIRRLANLEQRLGTGQAHHVTSRGVLHVLDTLTPLLLLPYLSKHL